MKKTKKARETYLRWALKRADGSLYAAAPGEFPWSARTHRWAMVVCKLNHEKIIRVEVTFKEV